MKRKGLLLTGILTGLGAFALALGVVKAPVEADAALTSRVYIDEDFNNSEFINSVNPKKWVASGTHIKQSADGETFLQNPGIAASSGDGLFFGTKEIIENVQYIQFDMKMPDDMGDDWIGIKFLANKIGDTGQDFADYTYNYAFGMKTNGYFAVECDDPVVVSMSGSNYTQMTGHSNIKGLWITYKMVPTSATAAKLYMAEQGESFNEYYISLSSADVNVVSFLNCQFGFQSSNPAPKYAIDNVKIKGTDVDVDYNFDTYNEDESILGNKLLTSDKKPFEHVCTSSLNITDEAVANESIVSVVSAKEGNPDAPKSIKALDISFKAHIPSEAASTDVFALAFGLDETNSPLSSAGGVIEFSKSDIKLKVLEEGSLVQEGSVVTSALASSTGSAEISIIVHMNGNIEISVNDTLLMSKEGKIGKYAGHFGIFALNNLTSLIEIDDILVKYESYYVPVTKSVTHNFSNNFWGNEGYEDFYIGSDHVGVLDAIDGKLTYERCADGAMFGSAHQYDCFILDYKLCNIKVGPEPEDPNEIIQDYTRQGKWSGLDLSRQVKDFSQYGRYLMLLVTIVPKDDQNVVYVDPWTNPNYSDHNADYNQVVRDMTRKPIPADLFRAIQYDDDTKTKADIKEEDYLCFRWISYGNSIEFYLKKNSDVEFTKYATFRNINLEGYFCLTCTGYTTLQYDDFSMANTSPIYTCADNEAPETIIQTQTEVIYDSGNVDVNLQEEIQINTEKKESGGSDQSQQQSGKSCGGNIIASSILLSSLSLGGAGLLVIRKKGKKHEK